MADPFSWQSLVQPGLQIGGQLLGTTLANRSAQAMTREQLAQQQRQFDVQQQNRLGEMGRRNQMQAMAAPSTLRALGYRDPAQIAALQSKIGGGPALGTSAPASSSYNFSPRSGGTHGVGVLGAAATGAMIGSQIPLPYAAPIGAAAGFLGGLGSKIGQGRKAANNFVDSVENPFGADLDTIVKAHAAGDPNAAQYFQQAYSSYKSAVEKALSAGGKDALVARQSLSNPQLQATIRSVAQGLGVQI